MTGLIWKVVLPFGLLIGAFTLAGKRLNDMGGLIDRVGGDVAQTQLDTVVKQVENEVASGGVKITTQSAFVAFVRNSMSGGGKGGDPTVDRFGNTLALHIVDADRFVVVSCGRDKQCQTRDDLIAWGTFSREGAKGGENVPGWPRERVVEVPPETDDGEPAKSDLTQLAKSAAAWLRDRPWISGGLGGLWVLSFVSDLVRRRKGSKGQGAPAHLGERSAPVRSRPSVATPIAMADSPPVARPESLELEPMTGPAPMAAVPRTLAPAARPELGPMDGDDDLLAAAPSSGPHAPMSLPAAGTPSGQHPVMPLPPFMGPPSGQHRAMPAPPPPIAVAELPPLLGGQDDPVALPHAPTLAAFTPQPPAPPAYAPAPARRLAPIAPIEPLGLEPMDPSAPLEQIDPFADEPPSPPTVARAAPAAPAFAPMPSPPLDLPAFAPEPPARPAPTPRAAAPIAPVAASPGPAEEAVSVNSGAYSISRGTPVTEGDGPSSMREDLRVPTARPKPAPAGAPARPRKNSGEQPAVVIERVRPGGIVTETQRIKAHHLRKEEKGE